MNLSPLLGERGPLRRSASLGVLQGIRKIPIFCPPRVNFCSFSLIPYDNPYGVPLCILAVFPGSPRRIYVVLATCFHSVFQRSLHRILGVLATCSKGPRNGKSCICFRDIRNAISGGNISIRRPAIKSRDGTLKRVTLGFRCIYNRFSR